MKIRELVDGDPVWVSPHVSVADVARVMQECNCAFVPILEDSRPVGVVTDRDVAMVLAIGGRNPTGTRIEEVMNKLLFGVDADSTPEEAAQEMIRRNVRRLIVLDDGFFAGVISVFDLAGLISDEQIARTLHDLVDQRGPIHVHHETHTIPGQYLG